MRYTMVAFMISVIIPAYNEELRIARCLESLTRQTTREQYEVIVVDNASTDHTVETAERFKNRLRLRIIVEQRKGRGAARSAGFNAARGDILLSTDADTQVPPDWLDSLVSSVRDPHTIAVTGSCILSERSAFSNFFFRKIHRFVMWIYALFTGHYWLSGFNFAIRRDAYIRSGGFRPDLNALEDIDLGFRVAKLGTIRYIALCVKSSARRFRSGVLIGSLPYFRSFYEYYVQKKQVAMSDVR